MEFKMKLSPETQLVINSMRMNIVNAAAQGGEGHIASAFSVLDLIWVLYDRVLQIDPQNPNESNRDRFILSKGHASLGHYAVLAEKGFFPVSELQEFASSHSRLGGHADRNRVPGVEASTGSLGHGFPMAVGIAMGLKIKKKSTKVFSLIGDGECNEGTIWESALLANHHSLNNLRCIVDHNHSTDRALLVDDLCEKFNAFGWVSFPINGHDHEEIFDALIRDDTNDKPVAIIAQTIKGFGCSLMENNPEWHHKAPNSDEILEIMKELK